MSWPFIGQSTVYMYSYAKNLKYGLPKWLNEYVLALYRSKHWTYVFLRKESKTWLTKTAK